MTNQPCSYPVGHIFGPDPDGTEWRRQPANPAIWETREINRNGWTVYGTIPLADILAPIAPYTPVTVAGNTWHHTHTDATMPAWYCDDLEHATHPGAPLYNILTALHQAQTR